MHRIRQIATLVLVSGLIFAACSASGGPQATSAAPGGSVAGATSSVTVGTASSPTLGTFLTGPNGKTLYTHAGDSMNVSTCTGSCLTAWPPLTVAAGRQPAAGPGVSGKLGTFARPDGSSQVTYNGLPLYYWQGDAKPGDTTGQGVGGFSVALASGSAPASASGSAPASAAGSAAPSTANPKPSY